MDVKRRFSVVMPAYNSRATIAHSLESALAQTLPPHEIIVVDDGSRDGTADFVRDQFGDRVRVISQQNAGPSRARNRGVQEASGDWIAFLDSDDEWLPSKLATQSAFLDCHPDAVLCATSFVARQEDGREEAVSLPLEMSRAAILEELSRRTLFLLSSVALRRDVFLTLGGFPEHMHCSEDRDLWTRTAIRYPVVTLDEPLTRKHELTGSLSTNPEKTLRDGLEANRRVIGLLASEGVIANQAAFLRRANSLLYRSVAILYAEQGKRSPGLNALTNSIKQDPIANLSEWRRRFGLFLRLAR